MTAVEVNGSFYSLQRPNSYAAWSAAVPDGFLLAVKGGRFITHLKRLTGVEGALANFFASGVLALGDKLGPALWQLPEAREVLRRNDICMVVADRAGRWPQMPDATSDFRYARLHGETEIYASGYTDDSLDRWADQCHSWLDATGDAARRLLLGAPSRGARSASVACHGSVRVVVLRFEHQFERLGGGGTGWALQRWRRWSRRRACPSR